jgi:acylphosphatase
MAVRRRIKAHGRVQGVFFRDATRREAQRRGVAGWVRNAGDGTVDAVFEGEQEDVEAMVALCRKGPGHSKVGRLEVAEENPEGLSRFEVR